MDEQDALLHKEEAAEKGLETLLKRVTNGLASMTATFDQQRRTFIEREQQRKRDEEEQGFGFAGKRREALLAADEGEGEDRGGGHRPPSLVEKRKQREEEVLKFERLKDRHVQLRKGRLKKEGYYEAKEHSRL